MAATANAFGLLLEDGDPGAAGSGKKPRNRKKKAKAPAAPPAAGVAEAAIAAPEAQAEAEAAAPAPVPAPQEEGPPDGFQTVIKGSRGKSLPAAKSVDSLPGAALAVEARKAAEAQAGSPAIQDTIDTWANKLQREKSPSYLDEGGKLLSWREVLLGSTALEALLGTCLRERLDASLEAPLAAVLLACAGGRGPEPQRLAPGIAATVVRLAGSLQPGAGPDRAAALALLRRLLALLRAPPQAPPARPPAAPAPAAVPGIEAQLGQKLALLRAAKPAKQAELWREVQLLLDAAGSGSGSPQQAPEPPAAAALREYESALQALQQDPATQKQAARAEGERLQASQASLESRLKEARALVQSLQQQLATVQQSVAAHQASVEQPRAQVSGAALQQQLAAAAALRASLGCEQAPAPQQPPVGQADVGPQARAALGEAASALLVSQLKQQRELAARGRHTADRLARKKTQLAQLAGLGDGKEHRAAAAQLQQLEQEAQKQQRESASACHLAESLAAALQRAGAGPQSATEAGQIAAACRQQHAAILEGPLRLGTPWLESLVQGPSPQPQQPQTQQAPAIGQVVAPAQGLPSPIARPQPAAPPPPQQQQQQAQAQQQQPMEAASVQQAPAYNQWAVEGSPAQPAWGLPPPASSFGELLQGSSVSQAPSKVPAPIAPASLGLQGLGGEPALRPPVPSLPPVGNAHIGSGVPTPRQNGAPPPEQQALRPSVAAAAGGHSGANGTAVAGEGAGKPKRSRPRKPRAPGA